MAAKTDREQIEELMAAYANAIDAKDYDAIAACLTPDAEAAYPGFSDALRGPAEIAAHMQSVLELLDATQHLFANFIIDIEGDQARLSAGIIAQHVRGAETYMAGNTYKVAAKKLAGVWKIAEISLGPVIWSQGNREILPRVR